MKFRLAGALGLWAAVTVTYAAREAWAAARYGFDLSLPSISYRMGILLMVSLMFGLFARRLGQRSDELAVALDEVGREERWRSALIDMLAHDFRSPVGSATSGLQLVSLRMDDLPNEQLRSMVDAAVRQNRRALALADDILTLASAGHGRLELSRQDVEIPPLLAGVVEALGMDDDVTVESRPDLRGFVDSARTEQIVSNLLSNSEKHGGPPMTVTASPLPDGGVELRVADSGDGVPEEQQADLFGQFSSGPRADSVGLGLWLVSTLAAAHGGEASYLSNDGQPTVMVRLPGDVRDASQGPLEQQASPQE